TADSSGNFSTTWDVPLDQDEVGATLQLTATGQTSGLIAQTTFIDANYALDAVFPYRLTGGSITFSVGGAGTGNHFVWHRQLPSGSYSYTGFSFNGSQSPNFTFVWSGATAPDTYEFNVAGSSTIAPTSCGGGSCGHYGIWGANQASFAGGDTLTISGGGAFPSQTAPQGGNDRRVKVGLFNPSNVQIASVILNTDAN